MPSVVQLCSIAESINESFCSGLLYVILKDSIFQLSSPLRHMAELSKVFKMAGVNTILKPIIFHTDGGPDHRSTFLSVQVSLICLPTTQPRLAGGGQNNSNEQLQEPGRTFHVASEPGLPGHQNHACTNARRYGETFEELGLDDSHPQCSRVCPSAE